MRTLKGVLLRAMLRPIGSLFFQDICQPLASGLPQKNNPAQQHAAPGKTVSRNRWLQVLMRATQEEHVGALGSEPIRGLLKLAAQRCLL